jgi:hypothetical protein
MTTRGWAKPFEDPIPLSSGRQLVSLQDAADYILKLPKAEQSLKEWQLATSCLIQAAEGRATDACPHRCAQGAPAGRQAGVR